MFLRVADANITITSPMNNSGTPHSTYHLNGSTLLPIAPAIMNIPENIISFMAFSEEDVEEDTRLRFSRAQSISPVTAAVIPPASISPNRVNGIIGTDMDIRGPETGGCIVGTKGGLRRIRERIPSIPLAELQRAASSPFLFGITFSSPLIRFFQSPSFREL